MRCLQGDLVACYLCSGLWPPYSTRMSFSEYTFTEEKHEIFTDDSNFAPLSFGGLKT